MLRYVIVFLKGLLQFLGKLTNLLELNETLMEALIIISNSFLRYDYARRDMYNAVKHLKVSWYLISLVQNSTKPYVVIFEPWLSSLGAINVFHKIILQQTCSYHGTPDIVLVKLIVDLHFALYEYLPFQQEANVNKIKDIYKDISSKFLLIASKSTSTLICYRAI